MEELKLAIIGAGYVYPELIEVSSKEEKNCRFEMFA